MNGSILIVRLFDYVREVVVEKKKSNLLKASVVWESSVCDSGWITGLLLFIADCSLQGVLICGIYSLRWETKVIEWFLWNVKKSTKKSSDWECGECRWNQNRRCRRIRKYWVTRNKSRGFYTHFNTITSSFSQQFNEQNTHKWTFQLVLVLNFQSWSREWNKEKKRMYIRVEPSTTCHVALLSIRFLKVLFMVKLVAAKIVLEKSLAQNNKSVGGFPSPLLL